MAICNREGHQLSPETVQRAMRPLISLQNISQENIYAIHGVQDIEGDCARRGRTLHFELLLAASSENLSGEA